MLLTEETSDEGVPRIYATQIASVVSYFVDDGDDGTKLIVEPGEYACRWTTTQAKLDAVRDAVLNEVANRLNCPTSKVECRSLSDIALVADPLLKSRPSWTSRARPRRSTR